MQNPAYNSKTDLYYNRDRPSIVSLIAEGPNTVLDLGCGAGAVGRNLLQLHKARDIVGVELFPAAAAEAGRHYSRVYTGDIEQMELPYDQYFDYVICGDILEHLKDPYAIVRKIHGWLRSSGVFVCSLPNVRHWKVVGGLLLGGSWEYKDAGSWIAPTCGFLHGNLPSGCWVTEGFSTCLKDAYQRTPLSTSQRVTANLFQDFLASQFVFAASKEQVERERFESISRFHC
jgi:SAM-dependent methyltransferase